MTGKLLYFAARVEKIFLNSFEGAGYWAVSLTFNWLDLDHVDGAIAINPARNRANF